MENEQNTALTTVNASTSDNVNTLATIGGNGFDIASLPADQQLEILRDLQQATAELEAISLPNLNSKPLVGAVFNILDANFKQLPPEKEGDAPSIAINFILELTEDFEYKNDAGSETLPKGFKFSCLKGSNSINDVYVNFFNKWRPIRPMVIEGMTFRVEPKYTKRGNAAIILAKAAVIEKVISKGK